MLVLLVIYHRYFLYTCFFARNGTFYRNAIIVPTIVSCSYNNEILKIRNTKYKTKSSFCNYYSVRGAVLKFHAKYFSARVNFGKSCARHCDCNLDYCHCRAIFHYSWQYSFCHFNNIIHKRS